MTLLNKKNIVYGLLALLVLSVPLTIGIVQKQQENRSRASAATTLSLSPSSLTDKKIGDTVSLDVMINPGTNQITFVKFQLKYDPTKLQPVTPDPLILNTQAFVSKEGPVVSSGSLLASATVGADPTRVIKTTTKVGTVTFKVIGATGSSPTMVTFENLTQALSTSASDGSSENVIASTAPASIVIAGATIADEACATNKFTADMTGGQEVPTNTSTASAKLTLDFLAQAGQANAVTETTNLKPANVTGMFIYSPAAAGTIGNARVTLFNSQAGAFNNPFANNNFFIPSDVVTDIRNGNAFVGINTTQFPNGEVRGKLTCAAASPSATGSPTSLKFELLLHGVGAAGDNPNPGGNALSNKNPLHPQRNLQVEIYDTNNILVSSISGALSLNFDEGKGSFIGTLPVNAGIHAGFYNLKVKSDRYLRRRVPGIQEIKLNGETSIPKVDLVAGDTNNDNNLNIIDYNAFLNCGYGEIEPLPIVDPGSKFNKTQCQAHKPPELVDIDDNGIIDGVDYNLFLRELSVQNGD